MTAPRLIVLGAGELGGRLARRWVADGGGALGYTATDDRHAALRADGVEPRLGAPTGALRPEDLLVICVPGYARLTEAVRQLADAPAPDRAVYVSSTGYYGGRGGLIDEDTPPGASDRSQAIAAGERAFRDWAGGGGIVVRAGGLYRPGRGPFSALARKGAPMPGPAERVLALIHYDDLATAILAALRHPAPADTYLAVTTPSPTRREFYTAACAVLDLPPPIFQTLPVGAAAGGPGGAPARHDTVRLRYDLLPHPRWPDWRAALA
jgi:nucleoside-diphosphate-sugar epimerase